jgi:hypothetical protein
MIWAGNVAGMGEKTNAYRKNLKERYCYENRSVYGIKIANWLQGKE